MLVKIELTNCGPFRGKHEIALGPGAYAITAREELNREKSNKIGKSFLLEMIEFAITGRLSPSRAGGADGWITNGEKEGEIVVMFEDGAMISRSKKRGQSTQVRFLREGHKEAAQAAAEAEILGYLALTPEDFRNSAYLEQKKMARLVDPELTKPAERLEIVSGWFDLGLAERAEERAAEIAADDERVLTSLVMQRESIVMPETGTQSEADLLEEVSTARTKLARVRTREESFRNLTKARETIATNAERVARVKVLKGEIDALKDIEQEAAAAEVEITRNLIPNLNDAARDLSTKKRVSLGQFDGKCPVASIACPATDKINTMRAESAKALALATKAHEAASDVLEEARRKEAPLREQMKTLNWKTRERSNLQDEIRKNVEVVNKARAFIEASAHTKEIGPTDYDEALEASRALDERLASLKVNAKQRANAIETRASFDEKIKAQRARVGLALRARAVFRKAQRAVAERNLAIVEAEANDQLAESDIDLTVSARWAREASGPAKTCEECGAAFPTSAKVKACERCGAARGQHMVQRLDFMLSDRSGAWNDIGGIAFQVAAGAWLLGARHSPWSTLMLDEPFAACDVHSRRALATQFLRLLSRGTYRQAIVISHSPDTIDAYPHKIEIIARPDGSRHIVQR